MKCLIIADLNNSMPINLSYFEVFVQHLIVYRDQLCQMGFKPKYGCGLSFPWHLSSYLISKCLYNIELFRDQLCQMGFKPKYGCELSFLWTNCTINIIIQLCNRNLHVGELGFKLSQRVVYSSCWTKLWLKKAFSNIQYELWVWFEKQGSWCFASLLWYWQSVP